MGYRLSLIFGLMCWFTAEVKGDGLDSLRMERRDGQAFVIHRVEAGETIFGLSRRYGTSIDQIIQANALSGNELSIGQLLSLPVIQATVIQHKDTLDQYLTHEVAAGETLYGISRQYGLTVAELKTLNNRTENALDLGTLLIVGKKGEAQQAVDEVAVEVALEEPMVADTLPENSHVVTAGETIYSIARRYGVDVQELREANGLTTNNISIDQLLIIPFEVAGEEVALDTLDVRSFAVADTTTAKSGTSGEVTMSTAPPAKYGNSDKRDTTSLVPGQVIEEGFAMTIDNAPQTKKYLALHRTVPIGTIMQVRNQMNNQSIFVRVVGKLPDTGPNKKVLIRLTQQAFDRLGAIDPKIPVEVAYMRE